MSVRKKVAFFGNKWLGSKCLRYLIDLAEQGQIEIVAVRTRPLGHKGWWSGRVPEVAELAYDHGLPMLEKDEDLLEIETDIGFSIQHFSILRENVYGHPREGFVNLHTAPLPHYRGCNTYTYSMLNGDKRYGTSLHYIDSGVDTGDIIKVKWMDIPPNTTSRELAEAVEVLSVELFAEMAPKVLAGDIERTPQHIVAERDGIKPESHYRKDIQKIKTLSPTMPEDKLYDYVRALDFPPFEPAYFLLKDGRKIYLRTSYD